MLVNCRKFKMVHKAFNLFDKVFGKKVKPAKDTSITGMNNMHTLYHWHENSYMDKDGYVYEVKKKEFNNVK